MPTIVAILGYIVGGGLMILGIIGFLRTKNPQKTKGRHPTETEEKLSIDVKNPQYYIVEQGKFTVELEVTIKCPHTPIQLARLQLLIAGKPHDFTKTLPPFKDEITTNSVSYRTWHEISYHDFLLGRVKSPNGGGVSHLQLNGRDVVGRILAKIGNEDIYSPEFIIESRLGTF